LWALATLLLVGVLAASVAELVVRFRRARGAERLQLTRLVWAVVLFAVLNSQRWITGNGPILLLLTLPLVPSAAAVAILRHDLYDIRVIVNRTLVYGLLTALLGLAYAGGVLVLGQLAGRDRNSLAVAGATLAVAAPLSDELLAVVDQTMQPTTAALWLRPSAHAMPAGERQRSSPSYRDCPLDAALTAASGTRVARPAGQQVDRARVPERSVASVFAGP
jgi:hypothetical protein